MVGNSLYKDATAEGIYNYIITNYPYRVSSISVIGWGKVGKALINIPIDYCYYIQF